MLTFSACAPMSGGRSITYVWHDIRLKRHARGVGGCRPGHKQHDVAECRERCARPTGCAVFEECCGALGAHAETSVPARRPMPCALTGPRALFPRALFPRALCKPACQQWGANHVQIPCAHVPCAHVPLCSGNGPMELHPAAHQQGSGAHRVPAVSRMDPRSSVDVA